MPIPSSTIASSPAVTCSPEATTASYSRASCSGAASRAQATSSLVLPAMAETTTATSWPASTSRLTWRATLRMRSISATDVPPNFITRRAMSRECPRESGLSFSDGGQGLQPAVPFFPLPLAGEGGERRRREPEEGFRASGSPLPPSHLLGHPLPQAGEGKGSRRPGLGRLPDLRQVLRHEPE